MLFLHCNFQKIKKTCFQKLMLFFLFQKICLMLDTLSCIINYSEFAEVAWNYKGYQHIVADLRQLQSWCPKF